MFQRGSTSSSCITRVASALLFARRAVSTGTFDHPSCHYRQQHTYNTLPAHDANRFGGRTAYLREIGPIDHKKRGRIFKRDARTQQFNVDVWCAQQTLRKRWKSRDWEVMEVPFSAAPRELQRVLPEIYTDVPQMRDAAAGRFENIRNVVYDREELQPVLYGREGAYPPLQRVNASAMTLDKFL